METSALIAFAAVAAYLVILGLILGAMARRGRRIAEERADALRGGLEQAGGTAVVERAIRDLYTAEESEYVVGQQRVLLSSRFVNRSWLRVNLRIPTSPLPKCFAVPEGALDRFAKSIGFNKEVQTGDVAFDELAYLDSYDDERHVARLFSTPEVRDPVKALLQLGYKVECSQNGVEAFQIVSSAGRASHEHVAKAVELLSQLAEAAPSFDASTLRPNGPRMTLYAWVLIGLVVLIPVAFLLSEFTRGPIARGTNLLLFLGFGGAAWTATTIGLALWLRGTSHGFVRMLWLSGLTLFSVPPLTGNLLRVVNEKLDAGSTRDVQTSITRITHSRDRHRFSVPSWDEPGTVVSVQTTCDDLKALKVGDAVTVRVHEGALGWPWVERPN
jgi:hypothetical protein